MKYKHLLLVTIICFLACTCQNETNVSNTNSKNKSSIEVDYPAVAQQICDCVAPLAEINKEVEFMVKADRKDEAMDLLKEVQKRNDSTEQCINEIEKTYPNAGLIESKKITSLLEKKCPKTAAFLSSI